MIKRKKGRETQPPGNEPPPIKVTVQQEGKDVSERQFRKKFTIGRDDSCELQILSLGISRNHAEIYFERGRWWIKDLQSANGTFLNGEKINKIPIGRSTKVELGTGDASLVFSVEGFSAEADTIQEAPRSITQVIRQYFAPESEQKPGEHTMLIRGAFKRLQYQQRKKYFQIIGGVFLIAVILAVYSYLQHQEVKKQRALAAQIFYSMKSMELELAKLQEKAEADSDETALNEAEKIRKQQVELTHSYDKFLEQLHFYENSKFSEKDRVILHVARSFGECELGMPQEFLDEVYRYIKKWKSTDRLQKALAIAKENRFHENVYQIMLERHLPPQFFYLALQESDFNIKIVGPPTRFGIAKGAWQFIPATGSRYGLKNGPLVGLPQYDPQDERFHFIKATRAAARYIRDIYNTEAQASGLLVMASYNWGEGNVVELIRKMPLNPQQRNFWELLRLYRSKIPKQTYDYVFHIFSAAVIGENPPLFGFDFDNPLKALADKSVE
jgi:pSer/pThr/pTyr-binding forkhead associated (FHA) protein